MTWTTAAIALGSNLGDREKFLRGALVALEKAEGVTVLRRSRWHETEPVGGPEDQGPFLNGAALLETRLGARELLELLHSIEAKYGREREVQDGPRTLDLDLLWFGDSRSDDPELTLPHPRMEERAFVLAPLEEVAPEHVLPGCGKTVAERLAELLAASSPGRTTVRLDSPQRAREWCEKVRAGGATLGFVPTMGALHEGHLELVRRAARENDLVVVSVFVNPLQFDDPADLERYPRDFDGDARLLEDAGCAMVFTGTLRGFFPDELGEGDDLDEAHLLDPGPAAEGLEGEHRPGHFRGVATIVDRLFDTVQADRAYFGLKDFQQVLVVSDLARRRGGPTIVPCETVREPSGLARSSRNLLLAPEWVLEAHALHRALVAAREAWEGGEREASALSAVLEGVLEGTRLEVEYAEVRDPDAWTAARPRGKLERAVALVAARAGRVRLIDNLTLSGGPA